MGCSVDQTLGPYHLSISPAARAQLTFEGHLLTLIVVALNGEPLQCAILRNEVLVAAAPEGPGWEAHIVEVRRLFKIGLIEGRHLRELRAGEVEGAVRLDGSEIRELQLRFAERGAAFEARAGKTASS